MSDRCWEPSVVPDNGWGAGHRECPGHAVPTILVEHHHPWAYWPMAPGYPLPSLSLPSIQLCLTQQHRAFLTNIDSLPITGAGHPLPVLPALQAPKTLFPNTHLGLGHPWCRENDKGAQGPCWPTSTSPHTISQRAGSEATPEAPQPSPCVGISAWGRPWVMVYTGR